MFAAASLTDVLGQVGDAYAAQGGVKPTFVFAASSDLARQIEQGAEADVFMSADEDWMNYLAERNLIDAASRTNLLTNTLVLIAPAARPSSAGATGTPAAGPSPLTGATGTPAAGPSPLTGAQVTDAVGAGKLAMADPDSVPAGKYGKTALEALGVWTGLEAKTARGESVRAALRFVESGEANAGIVYATDASAAGDKVVLIGEFDPATHAPIIYPMATIAGRDAGRDFASFLKSDAAHGVFAAAGFGVAAE